MGICMWTLIVGESLDYPEAGFRDLSFFSGPWTDPGLQIKNILAIPIAIIWVVWGRWIINMSKKAIQVKWRRYTFPVIFLVLGWLNPDVYPSFFKKDQYEWPTLFGRNILVRDDLRHFWSRLYLEVLEKHRRSGRHSSED